MQFLKLFAILNIAVACGAAFSAEKSALASTQTYQNRLGYSLTYGSGWATNFDCVDNDDGEDEFGCPAVSFTVKGSSPGEIRIDFIPGQGRIQAVAQENYNVQKHTENGLTYTLFLTSKNFSWEAISQCNGHALEIGFDYSPRLNKEQRQEVKRAGKPPEQLLTLLKDLKCGDPNSYPKEKKFRSPGGATEVRITSEIAEGRKTTLIRYKFYFTRAGHTFTSTSDHPFETIPQIDFTFKAIQWSPNEQMALLDNEVVSLDPSTTWRIARTRLREKTWIDERRAVGRVINDCDYGVFMFDGIKGQEIVVGHEPSPVAYDLVGKPTLQKIIVKKFEDNCSPAPGDQPPPACFAYSLKRSDLSPVRCPKGTTGLFDK